MQPRLCNKCYHKVSHDTYDTPFNCPNCAETIWIVASDPLVAPRYQRELPSPSQPQAEPPYHKQPNRPQQAEHAIPDNSYLEHSSSTGNSLSSPTDLPTSQDEITDPLSHQLPSLTEQPEPAPPQDSYLDKIIAKYSSESPPTSPSQHPPPEIDPNLSDLPTQTERFIAEDSYVEVAPDSPSSPSLSYTQDDIINYDDTPPPITNKSISDEDVQIVSQNRNSEKFETHNKGKVMSKHEEFEQDIFDIETNLRANDLATAEVGDANEKIGLLVRDSIGEKHDAKKARTTKLKKGLKRTFIVAATLPIIFGIIYFLYHNKMTKQQVAISSQQDKQIESSELKTRLKMYDHKAASQYLSEYFQANTWQEARKFIIPDANIDKTLARYWKPLQYEYIQFAISESLENDPTVVDKDTVYYFLCSNKGEKGVLYPVFKIKGQQNLLIDWRLPNQIEDISLTDAINSKVTGKVKIRCGITQEDYYNYGYEDKKVWMALSCRDTLSKSSDETSPRLDCYLKRFTPTYNQIIEQLKSQSGYVNLEETTPNSIDVDELFNSPIGVEKLHVINKKYRGSKSHARVIIEIDIKDPNKKLATIDRLVSSSVTDYYQNYQRPFLKW